MFSLKSLTIFGVAMLGLFQCVSAAPLERRLAPGYDETGGSATVQYIDPATNLMWIKNYHVHPSDGSIQEMYSNDNVNWNMRNVPSTNGLPNGGLAAFTFMDDSAPVVSSAFALKTPACTPLSFHLPLLQQLRC